ncbi:MAG: transcription antitermination factor NusB [Planctomycetota bacterium]|nr:transcription antitermination factor NusB [Planctomycetota bacterium]
MRPRTLARRLALQYLFMVDLAGEARAQPLAAFLAEHCDEDAARAFAAELVQAAREQREAIDALIASAADNWSIERIAAVERNILRLACAEFRRQTAPPKVILNEAVELAKIFGSGESGAFVNGVLDKIRKTYFDSAT